MFPSLRPGQVLWFVHFHCIVHRVPRMCGPGSVCIWLWSDYVILWGWRPGWHLIWSVCPPRPVLRGPGSVTASLIKGPGSDLWYVCLYMHMTLHAWSETLIWIRICLSHFCMSDSDSDFVCHTSEFWFCLRVCLLHLCASDLHCASVSYILYLWFVLKLR